MFSNLFFYNYKKVESELEVDKYELGFFNKLKNKFLKFNGNLTGRKKPKVRKTPILINKAHKGSSLKKKTENYNSYQVEDV